jgi:hypothetical protein
VSGTWIVYCKTCDYLSETLYSHAEVASEIHTHPAGCDPRFAGTPAEDLYAYDFEKFIPEPFKRKYWERKIDIILNQPFTE